MLINEKNQFDTPLFERPCPKIFFAATLNLNGGKNTTKS